MSKNTTTGRGTKVLLVDCEEPFYGAGSVETLASNVGHQFEIVTTKTAWNGGSAPIELQNARVFFVSAHYLNITSSTLHAHDGARLQAVVEEGALVVVFVGQMCAPFHLMNLIGEPTTLAGGGGAASSCRIIKRSAFDPLFTKLGGAMQHAFVLDRAATGEERILANQNGVTGYIVRRGKGVCALLPHFGNNTIDAISLILKEILPELCPHLVYDSEFNWLSEEQYLMPSLVALRKQRELAESEYRNRDSQLEQEFQHEWQNTQSQWNELLTKSGDELKLAVKKAFEFFGYKTIDVDEYWKSSGTERQKEEDLWLAEGSEPHPSLPGVVIVEVKSSEKGTASERDYSQLVKYLNRRKSEFNNGQLPGILIINHSFLTAGLKRPNAFSPTIVSDSERDGITLISTWDVFRLIQKLLANEIGVADIRKLLSAPGAVKL